MLLPPYDIPDIARVATIADPTGARLWILQPYSHRGAEIVDEPGATCRFELLTPDADVSSAFYATLFGWRVERRPDGATAFTLAGRAVAGLTEGDGGWIVGIASADVAGTAAAAARLGAQVSDADAARATVIDPQGARFAIIPSARTARSRRP